MLVQGPIESVSHDLPCHYPYLHRMAAITERILVISQAWVGDMVLAQSLYKSLKQRNIATEIDVVAPPWSKALLQRMPEVSHMIEMPAGHGELKLHICYQLGRSLRRHHYHRAIILPRSLKAALLPWFAQVPVRTGFRGEMRYGLINDMRALNEKVMPKIITRFVFLGSPPDASPGGLTTPAPMLRVDEHNRAACLQQLGLKKDLPLLALMPGAAFGPSKRWPTEHFADLARRYIVDGWQVWLFGSVADRSLGARIIELSGEPAHVVNLCGRTTLADAVDLISFADLAITNDSGLMHIAAAVGCPLVAVYGATTPTYAPPMTARSKSLWRGLSCSPCRSRTCRYRHYRCLNEISPDTVYRAASDI